MKRCSRYLPVTPAVLTLALLFCTWAAAADPPAPKPAPVTPVPAGVSDPLIQVLLNKGILTSTEAQTVGTGSSAEQRENLIRLLKEKGVLSDDEAGRLQPVPSTQATTATYQPAVMTSVVPVESQAASTPKVAPIIPAVAPVRVLQLEPSKQGGLIPDLKLGSGAKLKFFGFVKATSVYDTSDPQNLDFILPGFGGSNPATPTSILTGVPGYAAIPGVNNSDGGPSGSPQFRVKARATRFGMTFEAPDIAGSSNTITGRVEADWEGNYSRAQNRNVSSLRSVMLSLRLAWARIDHKFNDQTSGFLLFGQDWTPFGSSTFPNMLETTGGSIYFGNIWERAPQFRAGIYHNFGGDRNYTIGVEPAIVMSSFGLQPADVGEQLAVAERQGADSGKPEVQGRVVFQWQLDKAKGVAPAQIIFSATHASRTAIVTRQAIAAANCSATLACSAGSAAQKAALASLVAAFPNGAEVSSDRYGVSAEVQLPTRWFTFVAKVYNGEDLRWYFGGQIFSNFNNNTAQGLLALPGGAPCEGNGGGCISAPSIDAASTVRFGFDANGTPHVMPQSPVRASGGFGQLSFPLSRIFHASPEGRNAGWTFAMTYGYDSADGTDVRVANPTGGRAKSDMVVGTLTYKMNQLVSFGYELAMYRTRSTCLATTFVLTSPSGMSCPATTYRGMAARQWHDIRNEFGPTFTF